MADRINVVEGILDDLWRGHVPNVFAERGWKAEWKYNRKGAVKNILLGATVATAAVLLLAAKKKSKSAASAAQG